MIARMRYQLAVTWLVAGSFASVAFGQQGPLPAIPVPVAPAPGQPIAPPIAPPILGQPVPQPLTPAVPPVYQAPPPPAYQAPLPPVAPPVYQAPLPPVVPPPVALPNPGVVPPDPGRDGWANLGLTSKPEGLFLNSDLGILWPSVKNHLSATVSFPNGTTDRLHVPQADLDVTAETGIEVGYRLADSLGDLLVGYRFLVTDGTKDLETSFGAASVKSRLDINQFDLDYATATYSPLPRYDLKFRIGARFAAIYLDSEASNALNFQQASNYFIGAGPSATIDFERRFKELPDLGLFARLDGAALTGQVRQKFRETLGIGTPGVEEGFFDVQKTQTSEVLTLQVGVTYHPFGIANDRLRITGGYEFQQWWGVGKLNGSVAPADVSSDANITAQGIFLRGEYDF
jgi:hypothetical protein